MRKLNIGYNNLFYVALIGFVLQISCAQEPSKEELSMLKQALIAYNNKDFGKSESILNELLGETDNWDQALILRAKIRFFTRRFEDAENDLRSLLKNDQNHPAANIWLAKIVAIDDSRIDEAIEILENVVSRNPDDLIAHYYLARCLEKKGDVNKALLAYQKAASSDYHAGKAHLQLGNLLYRNKLEQRAKGHFEMARAIAVSKSDRDEAIKMLTLIKSEIE